MEPERLYKLDSGGGVVVHRFPDGWADKAQTLQEYLSAAPHDWPGFFEVDLQTDSRTTETVFLRVTEDGTRLHKRTYQGVMKLQLAYDPTAKEDLSQLPRAVFSAMLVYRTLNEEEGSPNADKVREELEPSDRKMFDRALNSSAFR